jgi:hypothetical protein
LPPVDRSHLHLTTAQRAEEQQQNRVLTGQTGLCLRTATEFPANSLERIRGAQRFPLRLRKAQKGEEVIARFLEALDDRGAAQPPLLREGTDRVSGASGAVALFELQGGLILTPSILVATSSKMRSS